MITIRQATADDFRAVAKRDAPECWFGMVAERDGKPVAVGKVEWAWVACPGPHKWRPVAPVFPSTLWHDACVGCGATRFLGDGADPCPGHRKLMCWASFDRLGKIAPIVVQRRVKQVFKMLREDGEAAVYCYCNVALPTAERWLRRLGFKPMPEITPHPEYGPVWQCMLG